ncbi:hypothetical protein Y032_0011g1587 [Ancylostoma ceylanicum]|nr:hypothetical protein Y032_0011g1587 [Ancylostoma ceylanicum]
MVLAIGVDGGDPFAASNSTRHDRAARSGILSGTSNYGVFLKVSWSPYLLPSNAMNNYQENPDSPPRRRFYLLPSSDSDDAEEDGEQREEEEVFEQKVPPFLSPDFVPPPAAPQEDVKPDLIIKKPIVDAPHGLSLWKPNITKHVETGRKKTSMDNAMDKERFLLRKIGQDALADMLYNKRDVIKKHIWNADEIIFNDDEDISSVRSFIEERYRLHFGLDRNGRPRVLSEEEAVERDFLIDNSYFISRVILRMHNLEPDDYKGKIENFHMLAKLAVFQEEKAIRDSELAEMDKERQRIFFRHKAKSAQLARSRAGEQSSDDEDEGDSDGEQPDRQAEVENELIRQMKELKMDINPEQVAICVSEMIAAMNIHPERHERVRQSSPPRQPVFSEDKPIIDLPWASEGESGGDEVLDVEAPAESNLTEEEAAKTETKHEISFDWSTDLFPDEEVAALGEKRPLDALDVLDPRPKRRAVEKDGRLEQKPMDTAPPPLHLRSCLIHHDKFPTDTNEMQLSVKDRIKWREELETHSAKKKVVRFLDFDDPRNTCRFYVRPLDEGTADRRSHKENQLRDVTKQAHYIDCTLSRGHHIIRKYLSVNITPSATNSHTPEEFLKKLSKWQDGSVYMTQYEMNHPSKFLVLNARESKTPNGLRLPAVPGRNPAHIANISNEARAHVLSELRLTMRQFRQNRAGISLVRHLDENIFRVAGILILSDGLLSCVESRKLSNAMLHRFHPSQGVEDMLEVIDRCPYEELEIRHCVLAWGHDLIAYFQQSPIVATGRAVALWKRRKALVHLRNVFERKKQLFEQEGYRRRKSTVFWLTTIPEIGDFAKKFATFNKILRTLFYDHPHFRILDWALEVDRCKPTEKRRSLYTKVAVEERMAQLFDLCRRELDLTYFRYSPQKHVDRMISYQRQDYDCG